MALSINKNTKIFSSFSKNAGNKGCEFFNNAFFKYNIDAIYRSFSVDDVKLAIESAKYLKFSGCAISMPYKQQVYDLVDIKDISAINSESVNTITFDYELNKMTGYNTDYYAVEKLISPFIHQYKKIYILGNGGLAGAVKAKSKELGLDIVNITRTNWVDLNNLVNCLVFNCTPIENIKLHTTNLFIDCLTSTETGRLFHKYQSQKQFEIYTGIKYEL